MDFFSIIDDLLSFIGLEQETLADMERWDQHEWESHIELNLLGLERKNADGLTPYKFMMVDETGTIKKSVASLCRLDPWDLKVGPSCC